MIERDVRRVHNWGRIGTSGQDLVEIFADKIEAGQALEAVARAQRKRGVRICRIARSSSLRAAQEGSMPEIKQLTGGEEPCEPDRYLLIERICEPACGCQYKRDASGCDMQSEWTCQRLEEARERALSLAQASGIPVIYLSWSCVPAQGEVR